MTRRSPKMLTCPACRHTVSSEADRCPVCGHPIKRGFLGRAGTERRFNVGCLTAIIVVVALTMAMMCTRIVH